MPRQREVEYEVSSSGCHICISHRTDKDGYPRFKRNGKTQRIHRFLWKEKFGSIDEGLVLRHSCDNPNCINLEHLSLGTRQDNMNDMVERKRSSYGTRNRGSKLTEQQVLEIRDSDKTNRELSDIYGITPDSIQRIRSRIRWKHL